MLATVILSKKFKVHILFTCVIFLQKYFITVTISEKVTLNHQAFHFFKKAFFLYTNTIVASLTYGMAFIKRKLSSFPKHLMKPLT